ncbi:hypothetical protein NLJ89_g6387 [Agrocybe chaxingu]|uniref:Uncharacterized protein n=1 Tax=Agrocybe chaxingu TaxID=84603 RepID=A0A9W8JYV7_9AGAR|nr:hypothetical protein NLJ89_g6387 [Agrocybe chaxingu]
MAPKNKGKKGKKGDDDFWDKAGEAVAPNENHADAANGSEDENVFAKKPKATGFSALEMDETPVGDEDGGGLMSLISSSAATAKSKKKKSIESKTPLEVTAEDLADEEWGPVKGKKGKGKKGKGKKEKVELDEEEKAQEQTAVPAESGEEKGPGCREEGISSRRTNYLFKYLSQRRTQKTMRRMEMMPLLEPKTDSKKKKKKAAKEEER